MEELEQEQEQVVEDQSQKYIDAIKAIKSNSVSKQDYETLLQENKNLLDTLANGKAISTETEQPPLKSIEELRHELLKPKKELSDIEYVSRAVELRDRVLEEEGVDIFIGTPFKGGVPSTDAIESANRTANVFKECIAQANGSNERFLAELQARTIDINLPKRK